MPFSWHRVAKKSPKSEQVRDLATTSCERTLDLSNSALFSGQHLLIGYLACYLLLQEGNELNIMLVNTLQKVQ